MNVICGYNVLELTTRKIMKLVKLRLAFIFSILIIFLSVSSNLAARTQISSLIDLVPYLDDDNVHIVIKPGKYTITAQDLENTFKLKKRAIKFQFSGNNSTYDFTGVTIYIAQDVYDQQWGMNHIQILGNDNVLKNLSLVDRVDKRPTTRHPGGVSLTIDGMNNRIEGFKVFTSGSFPYGYGDAFGKGGPNTIKHSKHSACLIRGTSNHLKNCKFIHHSYGHCIFMQAAHNTLIENCSIEGETRSTDNILKETGTGSPADKIDFLTVWGYTLPKGYILSTGEAGIRAYTSGTTNIDGKDIKRNTVNVTVKDCVIKYMRTGVTIAHAKGEKSVTNCTAIGCENGFSIGSGTITNCKADVTHGPAFTTAYDRETWDIDIEITPTKTRHFNGSKNIAYIGMDNSEITIRGRDPRIPRDYKIQVGGKKVGIRFLENSLSKQSQQDGHDNTIINYTSFPVEIADTSKGNKVINRRR